MSPQPHFESASMLTGIYCVTMIHQLFQGRACAYTIFVIFEITKCCGTVNIRPRSLNLITSFLTPNNVYMQIWCRKPTGSEDRAQKRLNLHFLENDD